MRAISERQWQLINLAANGATDKEIAQEMGISVGTVRTYWDRLRHRYECRNRSEVIVKAMVKRANEEFNASMLNALPLFIWKTDPNGTISFRNEWFATSSRTGSDRAPTNILSFVAQEEREQVKQELRQALETGDRYERIATLVIGTKGMRKPHKILLAPMTSDEEEGVASWIGYSREMAQDADEQMLGFLKRFLK